MESPNRARLDGVAKYRKLMRELMDIPVVRALFATGKFDLVNVEYNLINPTAGMPRPRGIDVDMDYGDIITLARSYSVGIAIFSPLAKGALAGGYARGGWAPSSVKGYGQCHATCRTSVSPEIFIASRRTDSIGGYLPLQLDASGCHHANRGFFRHRTSGRSRRRFRERRLLPIRRWPV